MKILLANNHLPWENGYNLSIADGVCHWQPGGVNRGGDGHIFKLQSRHRRRAMKCSPWLKPTCQSDDKTLHVVDIVAKVGPLPCENIIFSAQEMNKLMLYLYFEAECWILNDVKQNGHPLFFGIKRVTQCEALAVSQVPWGPQWGITGVLRISLGASRASCSPYCGHWPPHHFHRQGPPWHQMANHACWSAVIWSNSYFWMMWWQYL